MRFKRAILLSMVAFALGVEALAQAPLIGQSDTARPGGVYTQLRVGDAAACAGLCNADGICLAWTYFENGSCELKAVVTPAVSMPGARSGLSARAPDFARRMAASFAPEMQLSAPPPTAPAAPAPEISVSSPGDPADQLLGGPAQEQSPTALRPRLGGGG